MTSSSTVCAPSLLILNKYENEREETSSEAQYTSAKQIMKGFIR